MSEQLAWCGSLTHTQPSTDLSTASWWSIQKVILFWYYHLPSTELRHPFPSRHFWVDDWNHFPFAGIWTNRLPGGYIPGIQISEAMGNRQTDIRSGVLKQRLKPDGTAVGEVLKNVPRRCWPDSTLFFFVWRYFSFSIQAFLSLNILPYMSIRKGAHL